LIEDLCYLFKTDLPAGIIALRNYFRVDINFKDYDTDSEDDRKHKKNRKDWNNNMSKRPGIKICEPTEPKKPQLMDAETEEFEVVEVEFEESDEIEEQNEQNTQDEENGEDNEEVDGKEDDVS
jgi:hypothetical protein